VLAATQTCGVTAQLQTSVPQVVPLAVQSVSLTHVACAKAVLRWASDTTMPTDSITFQAFRIMTLPSCLVFGCAAVICFHWWEAAARSI
jgi:hypothetical protein